MNTEQVFSKNEKILVMMKSSNTKYYAKKRQVTSLTVAGITVASLTGDNGLIGKTGDTKNAAEESSIKEDLEVNVLASYKKRNIDYNLLNSKLSNINGLKYKNNSISDTNKITKLPDSVDVKGYKFDILEDGTIEKRPDYEKLRSMYGTTLNGYDAGKDLDETKKVDSWRLFYVDEENGDAFFISSNTLPEPQPTSSGIPRVSIKGTTYTGSNNVSNFEYGKNYNGIWLEKCTEESNSNNAKATAYLCDPSNFKQYAQEKAKYAVGGPTIEILVASYYNKQIKDFKDTEYNGDGYLIRDTNSTGYHALSIISGIERGGLYHPDSAYWISSPGSGRAYNVKIMHPGGTDSDISYASNTYRLRPLVCFPASAIKIDGENLSV